MPLKPALLTIFGSTGDLARKKLYPALFALHQSGHLDPRSAIVGIGRRPWDDAHYKEIIASSVESFRPASGETIKAFLDRFVYHRMDMTDEKAYAFLWDRTHSIEQTQETGGNRLYFLATAPDLFPQVSHQIGTCISKNSDAFRRLMIEKPFGQDLPSARSFNQKLRTVFDENEIFRIDHYLGKEMLQNILVVRFNNRLFEPAWNHQHIDHIQVSVLESQGVEKRSGYYDQSGALRDMIQSHLLQLVALLAMNQPEKLNPDYIRDEKVRVLRSIRPFSLAQAEKDVVLAQYAGKAAIRGYRDEDGTPQNSQTETYAAMRLWIDNERWKNVPFYLRTGKRLNQRVAKITVVFRQNDLGSMQ
jgi:glucose-6-phosphate 1-dehydrogenase